MADILEEQGRVYLDLGEKLAALGHLERAVAIRKKSPQSHWLKAGRTMDLYAKALASNNRDADAQAAAAVAERLQTKITALKAQVASSRSRSSK